MKVIWDPRATRGKQNVASYIRRKFGDDRKDQFLLEVRETTQMLKQHPELGAIDPLFEDFSIAYRSIVINRLSKMVYFIKDDTVYIAAFWDCRREPKALADEMK